MECVRQEKTREEYEAHEHLVFFIDREDLNWWDLVTRKGFRHCFMLQWCEWSNRWLMVDWRQTRTDFSILFPFEAERFMRTAHALNGTVVRFKPIDEPDTGGMLIAYCSNILSRFLGLGNTLILTPHGLYRRLIASGGEVVFSWRDDNEQKQTQADTGAERT